MIKQTCFILGASAVILTAGCAVQSQGNRPQVIMPPSQITKPVTNQHGTRPNTPTQKITHLTANRISGVWQAKIGQMQCQISTSRTKSGAGFRAASMLCPSSFSHVKYWKINDNQLVFYDANDAIMAKLSPSTDGKLSGSTQSDQTITLWR